MNYFKIFPLSRAPFTVPNLEALFDFGSFSCVNLLKFSICFWKNKNKKNLQHSKLVNIWNWWVFLCKQIQGSEKCVLGFFLSECGRERKKNN